MNWHNLNRNERAELIIDMNRFTDEAKRDYARVKAQAENLLGQQVDNGRIPRVLRVSPYELLVLAGDHARYGMAMAFCGGVVRLEQSRSNIYGDGEISYDLMTVEVDSK